ncbi:mulatexin-like [Hyalella azteca]|uniref:Mulatexin-like n=1 Tax=Hyalella azteca TaxID=294128 RepID=A0A8B7NN61_HYAAZ|nr:mulatexin-like [Hyalella azteca]
MTGLGIGLETLKAGQIAMILLAVGEVLCAHKPFTAESKTYLIKRDATRQARIEAQARAAAEPVGANPPLPPPAGGAPDPNAPGPNPAQPPQPPPQPIPPMIDSENATPSAQADAGLFQAG